MDANTGVLKFSSPPDFENPTDADTDNVYKVQVTVTDSNGETDVQDISVTVTDVSNTITGTFTANASSVATATAGAATTADQLLDAKYWYMQYDGPTKFTGEYKVVLEDDGTVDTSKSTVKMDTVNYTYRKLAKRPSITPAQQAAEEAKGSTVYHDGGRVFILKEAVLATDAFVTTDIKITAATVVSKTTGYEVENFTFLDAKWYGSPPSQITDKGISGSVDVKNKTVSYVAKYLENSKDVTATYTVSGTIE